MTKPDLVNAITDKTGVEKDIVQVVINECINTIKKAVIVGDEIYLKELGQFIISKNDTHSFPTFKYARDITRKVKNNIKI